MPIDHVSVLRELAELRRLAAAKVERDPLPAGWEAQRSVGDELHRLGLTGYAADLETNGYTVLPPGVAAPDDLIVRLREAIIRLDAEDRPKALGEGAPRGRLMYHILHRDPVFEEALMSPQVLALVAYLMGYRAKLSQCTGAIKDDSSTSAFELHADQSRKVPAPWPSDAQFGTVTWCLTDYTRANGAVCVVPGTHKLCSDVPEDMVMAHDHPDLKVVEAPAGSVIIWHGGLWHGATPRTAPGERITLIMPMVRFHLMPQELFWASVTPEMLERNSSRFAALMGLLGGWPWGVDGPDTGYQRPSWLTTRWENRFS
ncbi:phytanoyl-CoA dioxygenase family protein [Micromonospora sp. NPDC049645]|uniref:phytanoyl-CoA dioxygenase family protein n=1 Tax=Micromonospora sp. NPDC049645 TaxID=3155508 RepID=UPI0034207010